MISGLLLNLKPRRLKEIPGARMRKIIIIAWEEMIITILMKMRQNEKFVLNS